MSRACHRRCESGVNVDSSEPLCRLPAGAGGGFLAPPASFVKGFDSHPKHMAALSRIKEEWLSGLCEARRM
jgi:hypothetical protein